MIDDGSWMMDDDERERERESRGVSKRVPDAGSGGCLRGVQAYARTRDDLPQPGGPERRMPTLPQSPSLSLSLSLCLSLCLSLYLILVQD